MLHEVLATVLVSLAAGTISAGEPNPSRQEPHRRDHAALVQVALASGERFWKRIEHDDPYPSLSCRGLLSYALTLCEACYGKVRRRWDHKCCPKHGRVPAPLV